jgi:hypothetical protein
MTAYLGAERSAAKYAAGASQDRCDAHSGRPAVDHCERHKDQGLRRFIRPAEASTPQAQRCEMCSQVLAEEHTHLVDLNRQALMCCCRACFFLFEPQGAGGGRYRPVPQRCLHDPAFRMSRVQWDELAIPVDVVFVFSRSGRDQPVAFYPSPAGATESLLPLDCWAQVLRDNPAFADLAPDVEAVLLRKDGERFDGFLVPIDVCYQLVGRIRLGWKGLGGGEELRRETAGFFDGLARRAARV